MLWQKAPHSILMNTSGQGCGFAFHQGNTHRLGWPSRWKGDFLIQHSPFTSSSWLRATSRGAIYLQVHSFFQQASLGPVSGHVALVQGACSVQLMTTAGPVGQGNRLLEQSREGLTQGSLRDSWSWEGEWVRLTRMVVDLFSGTLLVLLSLFSYLHSRKNSDSLFQPPLELEVSGRGSFGQWDRCA